MGSGRRQFRTKDMIFSIRELWGNSLEQTSPVYMVFIDLTKAVDTLGWNGLWKLVAKCRFPVTYLLRSICLPCTKGCKLASDTMETPRISYLWKRFLLMHFCIIWSALSEKVVCSKSTLPYKIEYDKFWGV